MPQVDHQSKTLVVDSPSPETAEGVARDNPALYRSALQMQLKAQVEILRVPSPRALELCREVAPKGVQVWGVVPPSGMMLVLREVEPAELRTRFTKQAKALVEAGAETLLIQSMSDLDEALLALQGAKESGAARVGVSLVFGSGADQIETVMGQDCEAATTQLVDAGADFVGCSCGVTVDDMVLLVRLIRAVTAVPILACPDASQKELDGERIVYRETPQDFASKALSLVSAGADFIGGCCGITHVHLAALAEQLAKPRGAAEP